MASPLFLKLLLCNGLSCLWHCLPDPTGWPTQILRIRAPPQGWFPLYIYQLYIQTTHDDSTVFILYHFNQETSTSATAVFPLIVTRFVSDLASVGPTAKAHLKLSLHVHILRYLAKYPKTMSVIDKYFHGAVLCTWTILIRIPSWNHKWMELVGTSTVIFKLSSQIIHEIILFYINQSMKLVHHKRTARDSW